MPEHPPTRTTEQRTLDTLERLTHDVDAWVATAEVAGGTPYLVPLSFLWDGHTLLVATPSASPTGRNLTSTRRVRIGIGPTRDVVLIEGAVHAVPTAEISGEVADAFAAKTGFNPRELATPYTYFRIQPQRLQAWREANELPGRDLMRGGHWLAAYGSQHGAAPPEPAGTSTHGGSQPATHVSGDHTYLVRPVGWVESPLTDREAAPKQGDEGAPQARIVFRPDLREATHDLRVDSEVLVLTWLHQGRRDVLSVHPRDDPSRPRQGVFSTRSPDRPNPIGLHQVTVVGVDGDAIAVRNLEAIDGTPVLDVKPVLGRLGER